MNFFNSFAEKHPQAAEWFRKGGLFLIFSWVVTAFKAVLLMFLPDPFRSMVGNTEWLWPNIPVSLFGVNFNLAIIRATRSPEPSAAVWPSRWPTRPQFLLASASTSPSSAM